MVNDVISRNYSYLCHRLIAHVTVVQSLLMDKRASSRVGQGSVKGRYRRFLHLSKSGKLRHLREGYATGTSTLDVLCIYHNTFLAWAD